jgi:hypothetical protein
MTCLIQAPVKTKVYDIRHKTKLQQHTQDPTQNNKVAAAIKQNIKQFSNIKIGQQYNSSALITETNK